MKFVVGNEPQVLAVTTEQEDNDVSIKLNGIPVIWFSSVAGNLWRFSICENDRKKLKELGVRFEDNQIALWR